MKTKNHSRSLAKLKLLIVMPVIATVIITFSSCDKNKTAAGTITEIAPPLPPPPPPPVTAASEPDKVYTVVDELAQFPNGDKGLLDYITNNTVYPDEAKKNNIMGKVIVKFVIGKDCSVSHVEVEQGVDPFLDAEAVRVVSSLPKFNKPAKQGGVAVSVQYMLPISFALQ